MFDNLKKAFSNVSTGFSEKDLNEKDIEDVLFELEINLLESDVATEVIDSIKDSLKEKIIGSRVEGKRISIKYSRAMVTAALTGKFDLIKFRHDDTFNLDVPTECPGVPSDVLDPKNTWIDKDSYDLSAKKLAQMFGENFTKFKDPCFVPLFAFWILLACALP